MDAELLAGVDLLALVTVIVVLDPQPAIANMMAGRASRTPHRATRSETRSRARLVELLSAIPVLLVYDRPPVRAYAAPRPCRNWTDADSTNVRALGA